MLMLKQISQKQYNESLKIIKQLGHVGQSNILIAQIVVVLFLSSLSQAQDFYKGKAQGWHWYEDRVIDKKEDKQPLKVQPQAQVPAPTLTPTQQIDAYKKDLEQKLHQALVSPTPEHVKAYMMAEKQGRDQAQRFSNAYIRVISTNPELSRFKSPKRCQQGRNNRPYQDQAAGHYTGSKLKRFARVRQQAQDMNSVMLDSCMNDQDSVGSLWPKETAASEVISQDTKQAQSHNLSKSRKNCPNKSRMPVIHKSQDKTQMTYPIATNEGDTASKSLVPTEAVWREGRELSYEGKEFGHLVLRKKNRCVL